MNTNLPDLYSAFDLDRRDESEELGLVLSARDLRLEQMGVPDTDPRRLQTVMAFAVLADPNKRAIYDEKINAGAALTWDQIRHLGNFGSLDTSEIPAPRLGAATQPPQQPTFDNPFATEPQQAPQPPVENYGYTYGNPTANPVQNHFAGNVNASMFGASGLSSAPATHESYGLSPSGGDRPTSKTRLKMAVVDYFIALMGAGIIVAPLGAGEAPSWILMGVVMIAYVVGFESLTGGTLGKKIFGYEVRDVTTGSRLSAGAAFKRNWWKFVMAVPGIGGVVSLIMAAIYGSSINPSNQMRGIHDKMVNAEVVKKN